ALRQDVRRLARARRATLVTVTHDLADAAALADRALLLAGSPASIVDDITLGRGAELPLRARLADLRDAPSASRPNAKTLINDRVPRRLVSLLPRPRRCLLDAA